MRTLLSIYVWLVFWNILNIITIHTSPYIIIYYITMTTILLVGGDWNMDFIFSIQLGNLGMSSSQLTNSNIFRGLVNHQPDTTVENRHLQEQ